MVFLLDPRQILSPSFFLPFFHVLKMNRFVSDFQSQQQFSSGTNQKIRMQVRRYI